jgi:TfoX/Sxy family transcriptional regulator of competence genes
MFGSLSAFVNGNMFLGLFGNDLFVRLSSEDQQDLLRKKGASILAPMKGKPMKDCVICRELGETSRNPFTNGCPDL